MTFINKKGTAMTAKKENRSLKLVASPVIADPAEVAANSNNDQGEQVKDESKKKVAKPVKASKAAQLHSIQQPAAPQTEKAPKSRATVNAQGHARVTPEIIQAVLADAATMKRPELAEKHNLGIGTIGDIISGSPYIRKQLSKAGLVHPKGDYTPYIRPAKK